jgi:acyl carrier protein
MDKPKNREDLQKAVLSLLSDIAPEINTAQLNLSLPLRDQVDIDSMDFLNFLTKIHEELGVDVPEADSQRLPNLERLIVYLAEKLKI